MENKLLNNKEELMMEMLWGHGEPMTSAEMKDRFTDSGWNKSSLFNTIQSLLDKKYIKVSGVERNNTQYARQFEPAITKDEYAAIMLTEKGFNLDSLGNIALCMTGFNKTGKVNKKDDAKIISELEKIIEQLRESGDSH